MRQCGVIISIDGERAKVSLQKQSACGDCKGCRWGEDNMKMEVEAINRIKAKVGDRVEIDMEHQNVLAAAFIAYVIPLITLILGVILGSMILDKIDIVQNKEVGAGIFGLVLTAISYGIIRLKENSFKQNQQFIPIITGISHE
ncbi:SoxR reducing system RseC family protein [Alkaliphilus oremlandii]|uniref:Positive regulator of sigma E, RseC/MucC n=1 Tax=Alkaliphilus oremlandii (strain OhILAs) TaxID=350688 RepID=A8MGM3_ALKOO|nr:SoxR reducing system RseC family protein [Alkaliphilus oremlandii]ABW19246.1 positive regulator of sigma E, RseC/MucC [Alkaliphilus oremlandii OhILAs]